MRTLSSTFSVVLGMMIVSSCVSQEEHTRENDESQLTDQFSTTQAFVLTVSTDEHSVSVGTPNGQHAQCFGSCQYAILQGAVTISSSITIDKINCVIWRRWTGACAGQGNPCQLSMNSDLETHSEWEFLKGCHPR